MLIFDGFRWRRCCRPAFPLRTPSSPPSWASSTTPTSSCNTTRPTLFRLPFGYLFFLCYYKATIAFSTVRSVALSQLMVILFSVFFLQKFGWWIVIFPLFQQREDSGSVPVASSRLSRFFNKQPLSAEHAGTVFSFLLEIRSVVGFGLCLWTWSLIFVND